jgi:hypothetical protein
MKKPRKTERGAVLPFGKSFIAILIAVLCIVCIKGRSAILDGETSVRGYKTKKCFVAYFAFDCLMMNGKDLRSEPLIARKATLKRIQIL